MNKNGAIYAILDTVANDLVGMFPLMVFKSPAAAVRYFQDAASNDKTQVGQHPEDYVLVCLGYMTDAHTIATDKDALGDPAREIILTGKAWKAAAIPELPNQNGGTSPVRLEPR